MRGAAARHRQPRATRGHRRWKAHTAAWATADHVGGHGRRHDRPQGAVMPLRCARRLFPRPFDDEPTHVRRCDGPDRLISERGREVHAHDRLVARICRGPFAWLREPCRRRRRRSECHARRARVDPNTAHEIGLDGPAITLRVATAREPTLTFLAIGRSVSNDISSLALRRSLRRQVRHDFRLRHERYARASTCSQALDVRLQRVNGHASATANVDSLELVRSNELLEHAPADSEHAGCLLDRYEQRGNRPAASIVGSGFLGGDACFLVAACPHGDPLSR